MNFRAICLLVSRMITAIVGTLSEMKGRGDPARRGTAEDIPDQFRALVHRFVFQKELQASRF
jgi:hypothetical protein